MSDQDPLYQTHVLELLTVANEFCLFTERVEGYPKPEVIDYYRKILPLLYLKGMLLPGIDPEEPMPERFVSEQEWETVFNDLRIKLGSEDSFNYIDYSDPADEESWRGSLADHLADIYQDLKDFIMLFQKNTYTARQNAVSECRRLFEEHWAERVTRALAYLHQLRFRPSTEEES